jgi:hypothetical protein
MRLDARWVLVPVRRNTAKFQVSMVKVPPRESTGERQSQ